MHAMLAYAALTESDALLQVGVDNSQWLWLRWAKVSSAIFFRDGGRRNDRLAVARQSAVVW